MLVFEWGQLGALSKFLHIWVSVFSSENLRVHDRSSVDRGPTPQTSPSPSRWQVLHSGQTVVGVHTGKGRQGHSDFVFGSTGWTQGLCTCWARAPLLNWVTTPVQHPNLTLFSKRDTLLKGSVALLSALRQVKNWVCWAHTPCIQRHGPVQSQYTLGCSHEE
jgi:hypothetical protein